MKAEKGRARARGADRANGCVLRVARAAIEAKRCIWTYLVRVVAIKLAARVWVMQEDC